MNEIIFFTIHKLVCIKIRYSFFKAASHIYNPLSAPLVKIGNIYIYIYIYIYNIFYIIYIYKYIYIYIYIYIYYYSYILAYIIQIR